MRFLKNLFFSFPIQLLLLHVKKHYFLLFCWVLFFGCVTSSFAKKLGIPFLFLNPEYLGNVNFWSFFLLGLGLGGFIIAWNITSYILNSYRFPFLATLTRPFAKFCINNFIIPLSFIITFVISVIIFQKQSELQTSYNILLQLTGFFSGLILFIFLTFSYFFKTNKDIFRILGIKFKDPSYIPKNIQLKKAKRWGLSQIKGKGWRVDTYLGHRLKIRLVRSTEHYENDVLISVFKQNHTNALILEFFALIILIALGFLIDNPYFRIPAGTSIFLLFSVMIMLAGALGFWLRGWRTFMFILLIILINYLMKYEILNYQNQAYGLNYDKEPVPYNYSKFSELETIDNIQKDKLETLKILENWKKKLHSKNQKVIKPKLIFLNVSGGGLRSSVWTMNVLQKADSLLKGKLFNHTFLITGASGGMIGAAYFRELYLQKKQGENINIYEDKYIDNISKDLLNAISFTIAVNDLFFPFRKFKLGDYNYSIDRGYAFERQLNENTGFVLDNTLADYKELEENMIIPMMILSPVISNDARTLYISTQGISYLARPYYFAQDNFTPEVNSIELNKLIGWKDLKNLKFISALRMSATFPYISPNVSLNTDPVIEITDAGMRDNFGIETSVKFLYTFRKWISKNTSGVIFLQIRDTPEKAALNKNIHQTIIDRIFNPIGSFYVNWQEFQDFQHDNLIDMAKGWYKGKINVIAFQYLSKGKQERAALSWHLTTSEKKSIVNAINHTENQKALKRLQKLMEE